MRIVYPTTIRNIERGKFYPAWSYLHGDVEYDHGYDIFTCNEAMRRAISRSEPDEEFTCTIICPTTYKRRDGVAIWIGDQGRRGKPYPFVYVCYADDTEAIEGARAYRGRRNGYDSGISGRFYYRVVWYDTWVRDCFRRGTPKETIRRVHESTAGIADDWFRELQYNERTKDIVFRFSGWGGEQYYRVDTDDIGHAKRMCRAIPYPQLVDMGFLTPMFQTNQRGTIQ